METKTKHPGGRPRTTDKDLTVSITTRLAADEVEALDERIKSGPLSRSSALRLAVLKWLGLSVVVLLMGCGGRAPIEIPFTEPNAIQPATLPSCMADVSQPFRVTAQDYFDDCTTSRWDDAIEIGFLKLAPDGGRPAEFYLRLETGAAPGNSYDLEGPLTSLWLPRCPDGAQGVVTWETGEPDWSIRIDATCISDPDVRIVGHWWGHSD